MLPVGPIIGRPVCCEGLELGTAGLALHVPGHQKDLQTVTVARRSLPRGALNSLHSCLRPRLNRLEPISLFGTSVEGGA